MESTRGILRSGAILAGLILMQLGCCTIDLTCGDGRCGSSCGPVVARDPLFDGTLRHRVKGSVHAAANKVACAGGCGEVYWDESVNDPAVCDRCEHLGTSVGGCGSCSPWFVRIANLWGTPYHASGCSDGGCLGHGSLINHVRGHRGCSSCLASYSSSRVGCSSCGHSLEQSSDEGEFYQGHVHEGTIHQGVRATPTPAQPPVLEGQSTTPSNAQHRMRLHQGPSKTDPNGRLSVQTVNGHKRLVSQP